VIHMDLTDSLEAYFQEAGRAGRDGRKAFAVLLVADNDRRKLDQRATVNFPPVETIKQVYHALCNLYQIPVGAAKGQVFDFNLGDFAARYHFNVMVAYNSLKFLEREGYIEVTDEINNPSRVHFLVNRDQLYRFQVSRLDFDAFIKLLLRSYTGMFTEYVPVFEQELARRGNLPPETVRDFLIKLSKLQIIRYIPAKKTPLVIFTEERLDEKNLRISPDRYRTRREKYLEKHEAVWEYAENNEQCRSRKLLEYFGEKTAADCGICDICRDRTSEPLSKPEFDKLAEQITKIILQNPMTMEEISAVLGVPDEHLDTVIRWLLDHGEAVLLEGEKIAPATKK